MALVHCDGFDGQMALVTGSQYTFPIGSSSFAVYGAGRLGGSSLMTTIKDNANGWRLQRAVPSAPTYTTGFAAITTSTTFDTSPCWLVTFGTGSTYPLVLWYSPVSGTVSVSNGATVLGSAPITTNSWHFFEVQATAAATAAGTATVRVDGTTVITATSVNWGGANWASIGLSVQNTATSNPSGGARYAGSFDDWYITNPSGSVNTGFLGDVRVVNIVPNAPGSATGMTPSAGSNWQCVDEVPPSGSDYVSSPTPGTSDLYSMGDLPLGTTTVHGVQVNAYAAKSDAGAISGRILTRTAGTTYSGSDLVLSTAYQVFPAVMDQAPDGTPWTPAKINAVEFGWEVRA